MKEKSILIWANAWGGKILTETNKQKLWVMLAVKTERKKGNFVRYVSEWNSIILTDDSEKTEFFNFFLLYQRKWF